MCCVHTGFNFMSERLPPYQVLLWVLQKWTAVFSCSIWIVFIYLQTQSSLFVLQIVFSFYFPHALPSSLSLPIIIIIDLIYSCYFSVLTFINVVPYFWCIFIQCSLYVLQTTHCLFFLRSPSSHSLSLFPCILYLDVTDNGVVYSTGSVLHNSDDSHLLWPVHEWANRESHLFDLIIFIVRASRSVW